MAPAMRRLVKLPGPAPHATRSIALGVMPASASAPATAGINRSSRSPRITVSRVDSNSPSRMTATVPAYVEASRPSVIMSSGQEHAPLGIGRRVLEINGNVAGGNEVPRALGPLDDHERM